MRLRWRPLRGLSLGAATLALVSQLSAQATFKHTDHARLFPVCAGCHNAAVPGGGDALYPAPSLCENCHDGAVARRVSWQPRPRAEARFRHVPHAQSVSKARKAVDCESCHGGTRATEPLLVQVNALTACVSCHAEHKGDSNCTFCHVPKASDHDVKAHASCDGCHAKAKADALPRSRHFCLACHASLQAHKPERTCVDCHPMPRPRR